jgi:hypothetical protein
VISFSILSTTVVKIIPITKPPITSLMKCAPTKILLKPTNVATKNKNTLIFLFLNLSDKNTAVENAKNVCPEGKPNS